MQRTAGRYVAKFVGLVVLAVVVMAFVKAPSEAADVVGAIFGAIGEGANALVTFFREV